MTRSSKPRPPAQDDTSKMPAIPSVEASSRIRFQAAHHLPDYIGDQAIAHGHSWSADITVAGDLQASGPQKGRVMDMKRIEQHYHAHLEMLIDHADLNKTLPLAYQPPTSENVARYLLASYTQADFPVVRVSVQEGDRQTVTVHA